MLAQTHGGGGGGGLGMLGDTSSNPFPKSRASICLFSHLTAAPDGFWRHTAK